MDNSMVIDKLPDKNMFSRRDLQAALESLRDNVTPSVVTHTISGMLKEGSITRIGRNKYSVSAPGKIYAYNHGEMASLVAEEIMEEHPYLDFRIFELVQLNEFVNHQIGHNIIFVSVENEVEDFVFSTLWERHTGHVMLKPSADQMFRYRTEDMIVIERLPSESPRGKDVFWDTRIEKLLVDVVVDKLIKRTVYSGEYMSIFDGAFNNYAIDRSTMMRYARRRGALEKYAQFLKHYDGGQIRA